MTNQYEAYYDDDIPCYKEMVTVSLMLDWC